MSDFVICIDNANILPYSCLKGGNGNSYMST